MSVPESLNLVAHDIASEISIGFPIKSSSISFAMPKSAMSKVSRVTIAEQLHPFIYCFMFLLSHFMVSHMLRLSYTLLSSVLHSFDWNFEDILILSFQYSNKRNSSSHSEELIGGANKNLRIASTAKVPTMSEARTLWRAKPFKLAEKGRTYR